MKKSFFKLWEQNWSTEIHWDPQTHGHGWQHILWLPVILDKKKEFSTLSKILFASQTGPQELFKDTEWKLC